MKFFHLSDLHIGKQLHQYNLKEDQEHILCEIVDYAKKLHPNAIVIAGDVYDKTIPSAEAVGIFDTFLTELAGIEPAIPILIIGGNHDSAQRLDYASGLLSHQNIYIAGQAPSTEEEYLKKITLEDEYGEVDFYLLPFLKPGYVRKVFGGETPESYSQAVEKILSRENVNMQKRNVVVSHQFYTGNGEVPEVCESEGCSVGGIDNVDIQPLLQFEYAALGHLHSAQRVGVDYIRYCGTPLKYSVSEWKHKKQLHVITLKEKGEPIEVETYPLHPKRDVKKFRGNLQELLSTVPEEVKDDFVSITLTDEIEPYRPKEQLEKVFSHILEVRMDNTRTRQKLETFQEEIRMAEPIEIFAEFFQQIQGRALNQSEHQVLEQILENMEEE